MPCYSLIILHEADNNNLMRNFHLTYKRFFFLSFFILGYMSYEVGIYRGSFDPPHNGHLEAVCCALQEGISPVTIVYKDTNKYKPFRSNNKTRKEFLMAMFSNMPNVIISSKSYKNVISELQQNSTISKIYQIIGSDILNQTIRPVKSPSNLAYFIHSRGDYPFNDMKTWNNLPVKISTINSNDENPSSSLIRTLLQNREFQKAEHFFPSKVFEHIRSNNLFVPTDNEYPFKDIIQEVKKSIEKEILAKTSIKEEEFPLSFHLGNDIGISGLSGDLICFIADKHNQMRLVVKIFIGKNYIKNYQSELLGYQIISKLNLKLIKVPTLFFSELRTDFAFMCMSYVKGKSLAELMNSSIEAIRLCARANLELHTAQTSLGVEIRQNHIAYFEKPIHRITEELNTLDLDCLPKDIIFKLTNHWLELRRAFLSNPGPLSFTHGDPNHSNWIVDLENQYVTYIDLSLFDRSVSHEQNPYGFAMNELEESLVTFKIAAKRLGLPKQNIQDIQISYNNAYMASVPANFATQEARNYFKAYWILRVIENILEKWTSTQISEEKSKYQLQLQEQITLFLNETI